MIPKKSVIVIGIREFTNEWPKSDLSSHKRHDVEVFHGEFMDLPGYFILFFQGDYDTIEAHKAYVGMDQNFSKASYWWKNDTVTVRLFNPGSTNEKTVRLFGRGATTGVID